MPTVLRKDGFNIRIYLNDRLPSHVHVVCIEYLDEEEFPDTIRVIEKYEDDQCIRLELC